MMSGGYYDYKFNDLKDTYENEFEDTELNLMFLDFLELLRKLEWHKSGDCDKEDYKIVVKNFKKKWFKRSKFEVEAMIKEEIFKLEKRLLESLDY